MTGGRGGSVSVTTGGGEADKDDGGRNPSVGEPATGMVSRGGDTAAWPASWDVGGRESTESLELAV
eukprot:CAMPEP_0175845396 /NCGR_PEP_ID=MMETSP0107_2-20121207/22193_1 /TAXON_ID=195067 ORGANISM="Goniomonas pacifica, Strain CCMP1869" /NCGR_SAMPLE_ID=MMETSP0107_2 /ASSEMBLY_ACC=CAM_ASM_000203 /LENGTH=65 /DNA_ID=CAMNT_0017159933 /DNA_START=537 /DNA_END=734 /DNA_ORIENTATION=+